MVERPAGLPDFSNPPIDEVAISIQFPVITEMRDVHSGLYWRMVRGDYPKVENQPRIESPIESPDFALSQPMAIQVPFQTQLQGRTWLISNSDDYLIQIQNDRFVQNWRRRDTDYKHFEDVWDLFSDNYAKFKYMISTENLQQPCVQQVEVTYINWIPELSPSQYFRPASVGSVEAHSQTRDPEEQTLTMRYRLDDGTHATERLYVQCQPAIRPQTPKITGSQLALVYRAAFADGLSDSEIESYANSGRIIVVNAFTTLTTSKAHEIWGRTQ